jgi:hypothetical protein
MGAPVPLGKHRWDAVFPISLKVGPHMVTLVFYEPHHERHPDWNYQ